MSNFTGILSIISNQSSLNSDLLLLADIPDTAQAMFAATQFLVKTRNLNSGQFIEVWGEEIGGVGIIVMDDARAASPQFLAETASNVAEVAAAAPGGGVKRAANIHSSKTTRKKTRKAAEKTKSAPVGEKRQTKSKRKSGTDTEDK